ncbi:hypothetical protein Fmac_026362 [Flemingia macrophylla]|uniref:Uncharacterized protein n=1 Tax=Flemingia macrophylla TaxID=520843 RepID=A0ABD1LEW5_9FABA
MIKERRRTSQSLQKLHVDKYKELLEFVGGDHVFIRVTHTTGVGRALKVKELTPKYIGLIKFPIVEVGNGGGGPKMAKNGEKSLTGQALAPQCQGINVF